MWIPVLGGSSLSPCTVIFKVHGQAETSIGHADSWGAGVAQGWCGLRVMLVSSAQTSKKADRSKDSLPSARKVLL